MRIDPPERGLSKSRCRTPLRCLGLSHLALICGILVTSVLNLVAEERGGESVPVQEKRAERSEQAGRDLLPYNQEEIGYSRREPKLRLKSGAEVNPAVPRATVVGPEEAGEREGLLLLLERLKVPRESQVLVYSQTSTNKELIRPSNPRAIFFQDEIYVAWVPGVGMAEVAIADPEVGMVFYTVPLLSGTGSSNEIGKRSSEWVRQERCLQCHVTGESWGVPGLLMKSVETDGQGKPLARVWSLTDGIDWKRMWGGWYLSGRSDAFDSAARLLEGVSSVLTQEELKAYPQAESDPVALLLLTHQVTTQNLLIRYRYESVLKRPMTAEVPLARALLFLDVPPFPGEVARTPFAEVYEAAREGESPEGSEYRRLELKSRLMRSRVSPLLFGQTVQHFPRDLRERLRVAILKEMNLISEEELPRRERESLTGVLRRMLFKD